MKILIVEDDPVYRRLLDAFLTDPALKLRPRKTTWNSVVSGWMTPCTRPRRDVRYGVHAIATGGRSS